MDWPRILVGITTYKGKDYIIDDCYEAIRNLDYPSDRIDVLIVDNTDDNARYAHQLERRGLRRVAWTPRGKNSRVALTKSQNFIRRKVLGGDYDYLFFVESDLIIPKNHLKKLVRADKRVVGSTYNIHRDGAFVPCIFLDDYKDKDGFKGTRPLGVVRDGEGNNQGIDADEIKAFLGTGIRQVHGCGFGATLIHRSVLEEAGPFWCDDRFDHKHSDVYFYLTLLRKEIPVYVDTDTIIPHYPTRWEDMEDR